MRFRLLQTVPFVTVHIGITAGVHQHILPMDHQIHMELIRVAVPAACMPAVEMKETVLLQPAAAEIVVAAEGKLSGNEIRLLRLHRLILKACRPAELPCIVMIKPAVPA